MAHRNHLFPYSICRDAFATYETYFGQPHQLFPRRFTYDGARTFDKTSLAPGLTLIISYWPEDNWVAGLRLIDSQGKALHHWTVDPSLIWPESPYSDCKAGAKNRKGNYIHGAFLFENGDVVFNIEYLGLVRLDSCGAVLWKLPYRTHHSLTPNSKGNFWASGVEWVEEETQDFPGLQPPFVEEFAVLVSPEGHILKKVSLLKALFQEGHHELFWRYGLLTDDVTHLNDVEELSPTIAADYPQFKPGDLLVSFKHINTIMVLSQSGTVRWTDSHSFIRQHDPDFERNGWIVVFDNRPDGSATGQFLGGSAITAVNPSTGEKKKIFPATPDQEFYTDGGGKHALLENGNRLITESRAGRIIEVDPSGRVVWEWVQKGYSEDLVAEVLGASRYDIEKSTVAGWACSRQ